MQRRSIRLKRLKWDILDELNPQTRTWEENVIRELVRDEEILTTACDVADEGDAQLAEDLKETLESLEDVACLAANQIGETKQVAAIYGDDGSVFTILNPKLIRGLYPMKVEEECMTKDGIAKVTRYGKIKVSYDVIDDGKLISKKRDFQGNTAQSIQHMIDHCKGKLV